MEMVESLETCYKLTVFMKSLLMLVVINDKTDQPKHANQPGTPYVIIPWSPSGRNTSCHTIVLPTTSNHVREYNNFLSDILLKLTSDHKFREGLDSGNVCSRDTFISAAVIVLRMLNCEFSIF